MIDVKLKRIIEECILNSGFHNSIQNTHDTDWTPVTLRCETKIISMNEYEDSYIIILCKLNKYIADKKSDYKERLDIEGFTIFIYDIRTNRLYFNKYDYDFDDGLTLNGRYMEPNLSKLN